MLNREISLTSRAQSKIQLMNIKKKYMHQMSTTVANDFQVQR